MSGHRAPFVVPGRLGPISALLIAVGVVTLTSVPAHGQMDSIPEFYSDRGTQVPITLYLNQVGIVLRHDLPDSQLIGLANQFDLKPLFRSRSAVRTLRLPAPVSRDSLNRLARRIRSTAASRVANAGLVVSRPNQYAPTIVTDEFVAHFPPGTPSTRIDSMHSAHNVLVLGERPGSRRFRYVLRHKRSLIDGLDLANHYAASGLVTLAHPNFIHVVLSAYGPTDEYYGHQWHHENPGLTGGLADADLDTPKAWDLTKGSGDAVVAVIDAGFEADHPDLKGSLWSNTAETAAGAREGHDDDSPRNGYVDDYHGWDFFDCKFVGTTAGCTDPECGQLDICQIALDDNHGTSVAGLVAASADNDCGATSCEGIVGVCPGCKLMLLRRGDDSESMAAPFTYALENGADVITNSWVLTGVSDPNIEEAIQQAACVSPYDGTACTTATGKGIPVFFAMGDVDENGCDPATPALIQLPYVIAVGGTNDKDERAAHTSYGDCMDVMTPTHGGGRHVATADAVGSPGYNTDKGDPADGYIEECPAGTEISDTDYTLCFSGTSASTPMAAGVAGLMLSVNSGLSREQIQTAIQDTADKIDSNEAEYDPDTGFSVPSAEENTRGFGRINAYEAVRLAAPKPGHAGVDIMIRDNKLDWGNTEQPSSTRFDDDAETTELDRGLIGHWACQDVKIVASPCPATPPSAVEFDAIADGDIAAGGENCLYVRVRNRGFVEAASSAADKVSVKAYLAHIGTAVPDLPSDFWSGFSTNTFDETEWDFIGERQIERIPYSGSTAARDARVSGSTTTDDAQCEMIQFTGPPHDPTIRNKYCLLAMVDSPDDHIAAYQRFLDSGTNAPEDFQPDELTPIDNNVSHRNYTLFDTSDEDEFASSFYIRNSGRKAIGTYVDVLFPKGWKVDLGGIKRGQVVHLQPRQSKLVKIRIRAPQRGASGEVTVVQRIVPEPSKDNAQGTKKARGKVLGGLTLTFAPGTAGSK